MFASRDHSYVYTFISLNKIIYIYKFSCQIFGDFKPPVRMNKRSKIVVCWWIRLKILQYFSTLLLSIGPKTSVPSGNLIRSLSFRASSRYVFLPKDDVLDPPDCRKGLGKWYEGRRVKTENGKIGKKTS